MRTRQREPVGGVKRGSAVSTTKSGSSWSAPTIQSQIPGASFARPGSATALFGRSASPPQSVPATSSA